MKINEISRREFIRAGLGAAVVAVPGMAVLTAGAAPSPHVVSIVRIVNDNIDAAVEQAIDLNLIIAGTSPLATDLVGAAVMGFTDLEAIPTFRWAHTLGMTPVTLADIEVRGETIADVKRDFVRANVGSCYTGTPEIYPAPKPSLGFTPAGNGVVSWSETIPRPRLEYTTNHKAYVTWTNTATGSPQSILEQNSQLQKTGWVRRTPQTPGRYEFNASQVTNGFFRLRKS